MQTASIDIRETVQRHYGTMSSTLQSQARIALEALSEARGDVSGMVESWLFDDELSPATCRKRLNCLSKMGIDVTGHRPKLSKSPKWWLRPQDRELLLGSSLVPQVLKLYIRWVTMTGLRVEENLRLEPSMLLGVGTPDRVMIPGTKTALAAATLPISKDAGEVISEAMRLSGGSPFPGSYREWVTMWDAARRLIGAKDEPTATLKALRRNAARYLHVDRGMPIDIVRQYLRHAHIDTTLGYLKLTGGYGEEEMRRYL